MLTLRLDHAARVGEPLLVLVGFHRIQQIGFAGEFDQIRMGGDQGLAPVDERVVRGEEIGDVSAFLVGHGVGLATRPFTCISIRQMLAVVSRFFTVIPCSVTIPAFSLN